MKTIKSISSFLAGMLLMIACNNNGNKAYNRNDTTSTVKEKINKAADTVKSKVNEAADSVNSKATSYREEDFVTDVIKSNAKEIAWLNAGISKGTNKNLKSDARSMLTDHEKMGRKMKDYATGKNYKMPDIDTTNTVDINNMQGRDWDKAWVDKMVDEHQKLVDKFERNFDMVQDQNLKNLITKNLPTIRSHLVMVKKLQGELY